MASPVQLMLGSEELGRGASPAEDEGQCKELQGAAGRGEVGRITELLRDGDFSEHQLIGAFRQAVLEGQEGAAATFVQSNVFLEKCLKRALSIAAFKGTRDLVDFLIEVGAHDDGAALWNAALGEREENVRALLEGGIDAYKESGNAVKALGIAVTKNNEEITRALLRAGVDPNIPDSDGRTPLHYAIMRYFDGEVGSRELVEKLLEHGANISAKDKNGESPFDYYMINRHRVQLDELLLLFASRMADISPLEGME